MENSLFTASDEMYYDHPDFKNKSWKDLCYGWCHDNDNVLGFFGEYRFLSNFYLCDIVYDDLCYVSSENAYQAAKIIKSERFNFEVISPAESKLKWKDYTPMYSARKWENEIRYHVMFSVLFHKFTQNKELRQKLINTKDKYLEETNWWGDRYWGVCNGMGANNLGKQLMIVRDLVK